MKWLLISKQKTLKNKIIKEFKRKPDKFEQIFNWKDFKFEDANKYNRIILGDDVWKEYRKENCRWDSPLGKLYWNLNKNSRNWGYKNKTYFFDIVSQCIKCKRKGVRLVKSSDGVCKKCREKDHTNHNTEIVEYFPEEIQKITENEPQEVICVNDNLPNELVKITQEVIKQYFPEFKGIYLHYTTTALGRSLYEWHIALNPSLLKRTHREQIHTIAHELTHQMCRLQGVLRGRSPQVDFLYNQQIPHGELQTDMWTFARHPDLVSHGYFFFSDGKYHAELKEKHGGYNDGYFEENRIMDNMHFTKHIDHIHELSKQALIHRKNGMIKYRKWFRDEMSKINIRGNSPYES